MAQYMKISSVLAKNVNCISRTGASRQVSSLCRVTLPKRNFLAENKIPYTTSRRFLLKFVKKPSIEKYKQIDEVPKHYSLIYRNTMERYIVGAHIITFFGALIIIVTLILVSQNDITNMHGNFDDWKEKTRKTDNEVLVYTTCAMLLAVVIHSMALKFPLRIYKVPRQPRYVLIMNGPLPSTRKQLSCEIGKVKFIGKESVVPWKDSLYRINNDRVVILLDNFFQKPADLYVMLGEQKDPDTSD